MIKLPFFYGWVIAAVGTLAMSLTVAGNGIGLAVFLDPILSELDVSRSLASTFFTVATIAAAASMPLLGRLLDRFGARVALVLVSVGFAGSCALMGTVGGAFSLALGMLLLRLLGLGALRLVSLHAINQWFVLRRGRIIGYAGVVVAVLMGVFPTLLDGAVDRVGWRTTYLLFGLLVIGLLTPAAAIFMRSSPERVNLRPDGGSRKPEEPSTEPGVARRTAMLWTIIGSDLLVAIFTGGLVFHHYDVALAHGVGRGAAGAIFLPFGLASAAAILTVGFTLKWYGPRLAMAGMVLAAAAAMVLSLSLQPLLLPIYGGLVGLAQGARDAVQANSYAYYFGRRHLGAIAGLGSAFSLAGVAVGPSLFALVRDATGSYLSLSLVGLGLLLVVLVPVLLVRDPRKGPVAFASARS